VFTDRGDPADADYEVGDLTTDNTWRDLDLGTDVSVPVGTKAVLLYIALIDNVVGVRIRFRKNGNSNEKAVGAIRLQVANIEVNGDVVVPCDSDRIIEYQASNVGFNLIQITVKGWWT
jgi:hypothetical protein